MVDKAHKFIDNTALVTPVCHLAINSSELGQARKGATAAVILCARTGWQESHSSDWIRK